jgi:hypothetical protein
MRITDHYFWNIVFIVFFVVLVVLGSIILESEASARMRGLSHTELLLIVLASFRLVRLMVYDKITAFFREQFYDEKEGRSGMELVKPPFGPRRALADLLTCPWCFGVWAVATVVFFYFLTPYAYFPVLILALSGVATMLQLVANMIGWKSEQLKLDVESR